MKSAFFVVLASFGVASCGSAVIDPPQDFVEQQWTLGISRLGRSLTAVYPPSEDYQVGDVYAVGSFEDGDSIPKDVLAVLPNAVKLGTAPTVVADLRSIYSKRIKMPATLGDGTGATATIKIDKEIVAATAADENRGSRLTPTPILALPAFSIASGTLDQFGASFATSAFGALFGGASQKDVLLSVEIDGGETYGLDVITADRDLKSFCSNGLCSSTKMKDLLNRSVAHDDDNYQFSSATALIVKRVYMTRKINYKYTFASAQTFQAAATAADFTASAAAQTASVEQSALSKIVTPTPTPGGAGATPASPEVVKNEVMVALINDLGANLSKIAGAGPNSAFFMSSSYASNSVTLTHIFVRPVVIAYDALWLDNNVKSRGQQNLQLGVELHLNGLSPIAGPSNTKTLPAQPNPILPLVKHPKAM